MATFQKAIVILIALFMLLMFLSFFFPFKMEIINNCPKYEIYISGKDGSIIYRFNKITGTFQSLTGSGGKEWVDTTDFSWGGIKKP